MSVTLQDFIVRSICMIMARDFGDRESMRSGCGVRYCIPSPGGADRGNRAPEKAAEKNPEWLHLSELDVKYEGYIRRQEKQVERFRKMEELKIPRDFDYRGATGLSTGSRLKLQEIRPLSVGQASRISGIRSSDIAVLLVHLRRGRTEEG